jgi:hypothetical protein
VWFTAHYLPHGEINKHTAAITKASRLILLTKISLVSFEHRMKHVNAIDVQNADVF